MSPSPPCHSTLAVCVRSHTHSYTHLLCQTTNSNRKQKNSRWSYLSVLLINLFFVFVFFLQTVDVGLGANSKSSVRWSCSNSSLKIGLRQRLTVQDLIVFPTWPQLPLTHHKRGPVKPTDSNDNTATFLLSEVKKRKHHSPQTRNLGDFFKYFFLFICFDLMHADSGWFDFLFFQVFLGTAHYRLFTEGCFYTFGFVPTVYFTRDFHAADSACPCLETVALLHLWCMHNLSCWVIIQINRINKLIWVLVRCNLK